ncbi:MAG: metallophosphoesterase [Chloroflexi bacterium]|nr:metallophosphoesterase [Chloroflexota bacterium]
MRSKVTLASHLAFVALSVLACQPASTPTPPLPAPTAIAAAATRPLHPSPTATALLPTTTPAVTPTPAFDPFAANLPASDFSFTIPPAIQHVTETSAVLYFAFERATPGTVFYRSATTPIENIAFGEDSAVHLIALPDLKPGTTYDVLVAAGSESNYGSPLFMSDVWGAQTVTTPPFASPLRFAAIGDSGFGDAATPALAAQMLARNPAFVLHLGDVVYRAGEQRNPGEAFRIKYFEQFAVLLHRVPIYPTIGNHDVEAATLARGTPYYFTAFPPFAEPTFPAADSTPLRKWYAFSFAGVQFLSLDSQALFGDPGRAEQEAWLEERLADSQYVYTIPFFHVPPYSSGLHRGDGLAVRPWADRFEAAGVPLVISGHDHDYERLVHGPTTYIISGGGSATLYSIKAKRDESRFFASASHFTLFDVYPDRIEVRAIGADGNVIDSATIATTR